MSKKPKPKKEFTRSIDIHLFKFDTKNKNQILDHFAVKNISLEQEKNDELFEALESEIVAFRSELAYEKDQPTPGEKSALLQEINEYTHDLLHGLMSLDSHTKRTLSLNLSHLTEQTYLYRDHELRDTKEYPRSVELLGYVLEEMTKGVESTLKDLKKMPSAQGGRRKQTARIRFGAGIARVLEEHLGEDNKPTATRDGLFENIFRECLDIATGTNLENIHELAMASLTEAKEYKQRLDQKLNQVAQPPPK